MKVKAVVMRPDRTNDVIVVSKRKIAGKTFQYDKETYFLHPDRFQVTWTRPGWGLGLYRRYFSTYYYVKGHAQPLPVPDFKGVLVQAQLLSERLKGTNGTPHVDTSDGFKAIVDNGISAEELAAIFNPWFYRTIAAQTMSIWEQIQMWLSLGTALGTVYLIYALSTGHFKLPVGGP